MQGVTRANVRQLSTSYWGVTEVAPKNISLAGMLIYWLNLIPRALGVRAAMLFLVVKI